MTEKKKEDCLNKDNRYPARDTKAGPPERVEKKRRADNTRGNQFFGHIGRFS
jgi:hypothetical protein